MSSAPTGVDQASLERPARSFALPLRRPRFMTFSGLVGLVLVVFWLLVALIGPLLAPHGVGAIVS